MKRLSKVLLVVGIFVWGLVFGFALDVNAQFVLGLVTGAVLGVGLTLMYVISRGRV